MQRNELTATPGLYALLLLLAACGGGPDAETFRVTVLVEGGGSPPAWVVVASASGAAPLVLPCGELDAGEDPADPRGRCTMDGVSISGVLAGAHLVVKAPGFRTVDLDLPAEEPPASRSVVLQPLPDPVVTEDFATGLTPEAATATFQSHGVGADTEAGPAWALKFYIDDLQGSPVVYFQNSHRYALHYDFAYQVLGHHVTRKEFDSQTYQGADRTGMAGTLVWFPALRCASEALGGTLEEPVTVNFFPSDDLTPAQVLQ
ncbi:MAG: hypothetical protein FJ098_12320, partial [Deltaproteobacteria bacterium]|nr:hypothetical protein [Deltaproteobacteria bacterium]